MVEKSESEDWGSSLFLLHQYEYSIIQCSGHLRLQSLVRQIVAVKHPHMPFCINFCFIRMFLVGELQNQRVCMWLKVFVFFFFWCRGSNSRPCSCEAGIVTAKLNPQPCGWDFWCTEFPKMPPFHVSSNSIYVSIPLAAGHWTLLFVEICVD